MSGVPEEQGKSRPSRRSEFSCSCTSREAGSPQNTVKTCGGIKWLSGAGPQGPAPASPPRVWIPSRIPGQGAGGGGRGEDGRRLHPALVRQEEPSEREGKHHPPPPPRPHLGSPGGQGGPRAGAWLQQVWAASPRRPAGAARWAVRPPARPATQAGNGRPGCQERAQGRGRAWPGHAHRGKGAAMRLAGTREFREPAIPVPAFTS